MLRSAIIAICLTVIGTTVRAETMFEAYQSICVKSRAEAAPSLAAADAAGWMKLPRTLQQSIDKMGFTNPDGRLKTDADAVYIVLVGTQMLPIKGHNINVRVCAVTASGSADGSVLNDQVAAWAAVPSEPSLHKEGQTGYIFTDDGGTHHQVRVTADGDAFEAAESGRTNFVAVTSDAQMTMVALAVPSK